MIRRMYDVSRSAVLLEGEKSLPLVWSRVVAYK